MRLLVTTLPGTALLHCYVVITLTLQVTAPRLKLILVSRDWVRIRCRMMNERLLIIQLTLLGTRLLIRIKSVRLVHTARLGELDGLRSNVRTIERGHCERKLTFLGSLLIICVHIDYFELLLRAGSPITVELEVLRLLDLTLLGRHVVLVDCLLLVGAHPKCITLLGRLPVLALHVVVSVIVNVTLQRFGLVGRESLTRVELLRLANARVDATLGLVIFTGPRVLILLLLVDDVRLCKPIVMRFLIMF